MSDEINCTHEIRIQCKNENEKSQLGESLLSKSRRSSILKPPKVRGPLLDVNFVTKNENEDFDSVRKRRVSFAGVNKVREFNSKADTILVSNTPSYDELFSTSSDSSEMSLSESCGNNLRKHNSVIDDEAMAIMDIIPSEDSTLLSESMDITDCDSNVSLPTPPDTDNAKHEEIKTSPEIGFEVFSDLKPLEGNVCSFSKQKHNFQDFINSGISRQNETLIKEDKQDRSLAVHLSPLNNASKVYIEEMPKTSPGLRQDFPGKKIQNSNSFVVHDLIKHQLKQDSNDCAQSSEHPSQSLKKFMDITQDAAAAESAADMSLESFSVQQLLPPIDLVASKLAYSSNKQNCPVDDTVQKSQTESHVTDSSVNLNNAPSSNLPFTEPLLKLGQVTGKMASDDNLIPVPELDVSTDMELTEAVHMLGKIEFKKQLSLKSNEEKLNLSGVKQGTNNPYLDESSEMEFTEMCELRQNENKSLKTEFRNMLRSETLTNLRFTESGDLNVPGKHIQHNVPGQECPIVMKSIETHVNFPQMKKKFENVEILNVTKNCGSNKELTNNCLVKPFDNINLNKTILNPENSSNMEFTEVCIIKKLEKTKQSMLCRNVPEVECSSNMEITEACGSKPSGKNSSESFAKLPTGENSSNMELTEVNRGIHGNDESTLRPSPHFETKPFKSASGSECYESIPSSKRKKKISTGFNDEFSSNMELTEACGKIRSEKPNNTYLKNSQDLELKSNIELTEACIRYPSADTDKFTQGQGKESLSGKERADDQIFKPSDKIKNSICLNDPGENESNMEFTETCITKPFGKINGIGFKKVADDERSSVMEFTEACLIKPSDLVHATTKLQNLDCSSTMEFTDVVKLTQRKEFRNEIINEDNPQQTAESLHRPCAHSEIKQLKNIPGSECYQDDQSNKIRDIFHNSHDKQFSSNRFSKKETESAASYYAENIANALEHSFPNTSADMDISASLIKPGDNSGILEEEQNIQEGNRDGKYLHKDLFIEEPKLFDEKSSPNVITDPAFRNRRISDLENLENKKTLSPSDVGGEREENLYFSKNNLTCSNKEQEHLSMVQRIDPTDMEITDVYHNLKKNQENNEQEVKTNKNFNCSNDNGERSLSRNDCGLEGENYMDFTLGKNGEDEDHSGNNDHQELQDSVHMDLTYGSDRSDVNENTNKNIVADQMDSRDILLLTKDKMEKESNASNPIVLPDPNRTSHSVYSMSDTNEKVDIDYVAEDVGDHIFHKVIAARNLIDEVVNNIQKTGGAIEKNGTDHTTNKNVDNDVMPLVDHQGVETAKYPSADSESIGICKLDELAKSSINSRNLQPKKISMNNQRELSISHELRKEVYSASDSRIPQTEEVIHIPAVSLPVEVENKESVKETEISLPPKNTGKECLVEKSIIKYKADEVNSLNCVANIRDIISSRNKLGSSVSTQKSVLKEVNSTHRYEKEVVSKCFSTQTNQTKKITPQELEVRSDLNQYALNVQNLKYMRNLGFSRISYTEWRYNLMGGLNIFIFLPNGKIEESTRLNNTYYDVDKHAVIGPLEVYMADSIKKRFSEDWFKSVCVTIKDVKQCIGIIMRERTEMNKFYNTVNYLQNYYPCEVNKNSISFYIVDVEAHMKFDVHINLQGWKKITSDDIKIINEIGYIREQFARNLFISITDDEKKLINFVRHLEDYCKSQISTESNKSIF